MSFTTFIINLVVLLTAIPVGLFLAYLTKEELVPGRKWFIVILYTLIIVLLVFLLAYRDIPIILALVYMIIVTYMSFFKSKNPKFISGP